MIEIEEANLMCFSTKIVNIMELDFTNYFLFLLFIFSFSFLFCYTYMGVLNACMYSYIYCNIKSRCRSEGQKGLIGV